MVRKQQMLYCDAYELIDIIKEVIRLNGSSALELPIKRMTEYSNSWEFDIKNKK